MAEKIYSRQAPSISTKSPVIQKVDTGASEILSNRAKQAAEVASQSFVLGQKQVLNGIMDYGYEQAKDNPKQFLELTQSAFEKQVDGLPEVMRQKMAENFADTQRNYLLKVENNFIDKQDQILKETAEDNLYSLSQNMQMANNNLYNALANDRPEDVKIARQQLDNLKKQAVAQSGIRLSNGSHVYAKSDREKIQNGNLYDPQYDFEQAVDSMSVEKLREWDSSTFQNQQKWIGETGIDKKTYDSQSKYIASRLKALGDEEDRIVKSNAEFTAAALIPNFDPDTFDELKKQGFVNSEFLDALEKVSTKPDSVSEVANASKLINIVKALQPIILNTDDSDKANDERFKAATHILRNYESFAKENGLDIEEQKDFKTLISKALADKNFSNSLNPIYADSALKNTLEKPSPVLGWVKSGYEDIKDTMVKNSARAMAEKYIQTAITMAVSGNYEEAERVLQVGNREVIKERAKDFISREEFKRLETDLSDGKHAYFTTPYGGTFEFKGYSNKDAIFWVVK